LRVSENKPKAKVVDAPTEESEEPLAAAEETSSELLPAPIPTALSLERVDTLTRYMAELGNYEPISREEEHELAVRWVEEGDVEAARRLVLANLRLVVKIAMEYRRAWTNTLDLIQEGNVGLMEAIQRYDPYQGVKVSSYAVYWIRACILKYILDHMRGVRLGTTRAQRKLFFRLNKEKRELERQGYEVEPRLLAERLEVSEEDVIQMEGSLSAPDLSLDAPVRRDEGGATHGDFFRAAGASAEEQVGNIEMKRVFMEQIGDFAEGLEPRDRKILEERVLAEEPRTLAEMGEEFGVSRERVRQLEARIVKRLREYLKENVVDFEYYASAKD
jgi:RNA polymerase sigma-32 factor